MPIGLEGPLSGALVALRCGGIAPDQPPKVPIGPEKAPISPERSRLSRKDACLILSKNLVCKLPFSETPFFRGRTNRVFGKPCFCPLPKRGHFDENGENDEFAFYPLKTRVWLLRPPKTTKMTKMAGVTQEKAWFRKGRVCSSLNLRVSNRACETRAF